MTQRRRVAVLCADLGQTGGVRSVFEFIMNTLDESGAFVPVPVSLATASDDRASLRLRAPSTWRHGSLALEETVDGRHVTHVGASLVELEWVRYLPRPHLSEILQRADLVQVVAGSPAWGLTATRSGRPVCLLAATRCVWERGQPAGPPALRAWRTGMTAGTNVLDRLALRRATHVLTLNAQMASYAEGLAPGRTSMLYPGVDLSRFRPPTNYRSDGHLLAVGRLAEPRKDWAALIRGYDRALRQDPTIPDLVIAGKGSLTATAARALSETSIAVGRCRVIQGPSPLELVRLYQEASLFVLSSREEGFGIAVVEAMACGLPVVATRVAGTIETVVPGVTGLLVDPEPDVVAALTDALLALWHDPARRRNMGIAGRQAAEGFSTQRSGNLLLDVYDRLLGRSER